MNDRGYERDLQLDLFATQRGRGWQGRDLVEGTCELSYRFNQRRMRQRPLTRFAPQARGLLDQARISAVTRKQFGLVLGNLGELGLKRSGDTSVQRASRVS